MTWNIDYAHSHLQFTVRHMMIAKVRGEFERFTSASTSRASAPGTISATDTYARLISSTPRIIQS